MMTNEEYLVWCVKDAAKDLGKVFAVYAILLSAYWVLVA